LGQRKTQETDNEQALTGSHSSVLSSSSKSYDHQNTHFWLLVPLLLHTNMAFYAGGVSSGCIFIIVRL